MWDDLEAEWCENDPEWQGSCGAYGVLDSGGVIPKVRILLNHCVYPRPSSICRTLLGGGIGAPFGHSLRRLVEDLPKWMHAEATSAAN